jgi:hypothetical protein
MYTYSKILEQHNHRQEIASLKKEIVNDVLKQLALSVDIQEANSKINELQIAINNLTK